MTAKDSEIYIAEMGKNIMIFIEPLQYRDGISSRINKWKS